MIDFTAIDNWLAEPMIRLKLVRSKRDKDCEAGMKARIYLNRILSLAPIHLEKPL